MKLGAEPKKIAILGGLILVAVVVQFSGGDDRPQSTGAARPVTPAPVVPAAVSGSAGPRTMPASTKAVPARVAPGRRATQEFKPVLRPRRVEDRIDPTTIDPTLRTDLLAKLGNVPIQGGARPLFEFSAAPPPKAPDPGKIIPTKPVSVVKPPVPVTPPAPSKPVEPVKPQAPPIPLKFYGFTAARGGPKRGFFLENEDVYVANEGEVIKRRYKVVRISLNSAILEDTEFKQLQTLPLVDQLQ